MSTFDYIIYTREKNKTLLEVKKGLLSMDLYQEWNDNYFLKRERYQSKVIIEKKAVARKISDNVVVCDETKNQQELSHSSIVSPRFDEKKAGETMKDKGHSMFSPMPGIHDTPSFSPVAHSSENNTDVKNKSYIVEPEKKIDQKVDGKSCCSQMYCVPCISTRNTDIPLSQIASSEKVDPQNKMYK